jgi:hypothetical protein
MAGSLPVGLSTVPDVCRVCLAWAVDATAHRPACLQCVPDIHAHPATLGTARVSVQFGF